MIKNISYLLVLFIFWLFLSGHLDPLFLSFGMGSSIFALWMAYRMGTLDHEGHPIYLLRVTILYVPWLMWEVIKANWDVTKLILQKDPKISPTIFRLPTSQHTELGMVIYANSITLTPGTVTMEIDGKELVIHALTQEAAEGLQTGYMDREVTNQVDQYLTPWSI
ncbi:MAG: Na+/H+ antiporter subunit E, partial [Magnetococcales bacterium]|nr:Na+/H+ antiporter subunit E [Magnetococcales bacterium]